MMYLCFISKYSGQIFVNRVNKPIQNLCLKEKKCQGAFHVAL